MSLTLRCPLPGFNADTAGRGLCHHHRDYVLTGSTMASTLRSEARFLSSSADQNKIHMREMTTSSVMLWDTCWWRGVWPSDRRGRFQNESLLHSSVVCLLRHANVLLTFGPVVYVLYLWLIRFKNGCRFWQVSRTNSPTYVINDPELLQFTSELLCTSYALIFNVTHNKK